MKKCVLKRAVHIAAVVMHRAGLCAVWEDRAECDKVGEPPEEEICERCIEAWLLRTAKKELRKEGLK